MKLNVPTILLFLILAYNLPAQELTNFFDTSDAFFKSYVENGLVNYKAIKKNPEVLKSILKDAEDISVQKSNASNYHAFWINAYNLLVIDGIVTGYPIKSPLDIPGFFDKKKHSIGGKSLTLNDIENKMLRAEFPGEARFHFVLVCAGLGCPPIIDMAYVPEKLESQRSHEPCPEFQVSRILPVALISDRELIKADRRKSTSPGKGVGYC